MDHRQLRIRRHDSRNTTRREYQGEEQANTQYVEAYYLAPQQPIPNPCQPSVAFDSISHRDPPTPASVSVFSSTLPIDILSCPSALIYSASAGGRRCTP